MEFVTCLQDGLASRVSSRGLGSCSWSSRSRVMAVLSALWQHQDSVYTGQKTSWKWWAMLRLAQVVTMSPEKDQVLSTDSPKAVTTSCRHATAHEWRKMIFEFLRFCCSCLGLGLFIVLKVFRSNTSVFLKEANTGVFFSIFGVLESL